MNDTLRTFDASKGKTGFYYSSCERWKRKDSRRYLASRLHPSCRSCGASWVEWRLKPTAGQCLSLFKHVTTRCALEWEMRGAAHSRGRAQSVGPLRKPGGPVHPPAAIVLGRILPPRFGRIGAAGGLNLPVCALSAGRIDDPGDVAAGGKHEAHVAAHELRNTPGSLPGDNVVLLGSDGIDVVLNTAQIEFFSVQLDLARHNQVVLHVSVTEVPAVCGARHARAVAVPVKEVEGRWLLAEQVVV